MKKFEDLVFEKHSLADSGIIRFADSKQAEEFFDNGYGVSVLLGENFYSNGIDTYELAVIYENEISYGNGIVDGLSIEWGNSNFVNPPYSRKLKEAFVQKGIEEMKRGKLCVFLIPVSTSTELFHDYIKPNATEIEFVRGRIKFGKLDEEGNFYLPLNKHGKTQSGTKDSMVVVFDGRSATL